MLCAAVLDAYGCTVTSLSRFLPEKLMITHWSRNYPPFMETEGSLPY